MGSVANLFKKISTAHSAGRAGKACGGMHAMENDVGGKLLAQAPL
jgi:hypothetical protein